MSLTASSQVLPLPICADSGWEALAGIGARRAIGDAAELTQSAGLRRKSRPVCQASRYTRPPTRRTRTSGLLVPHTSATSKNTRSGTVTPISM